MKKFAAFFLILLSLTLVASGALAANVVNVFNWEDYISEEAIRLFEEEYKDLDLKVNYMCFTTNEDMMVQVRNSAGAFDVVVPSEYCVERMIDEGLIQPLDYSKLPNAKQYTLASLLDPSYDPNNTYSVPYMWGTVGILYNTEKVDGPIDSWSVLFDEKYKNNVFMLDSIRDSMGIALKYLGYSMNTRNPAEIAAATQLLIKQKKDGIVKAYQVDETKDKMVLGEAALALMWSGDAQYAIDLNDKLAYIVPKEGSNVWVDTFVIPTTAKNVDYAHLFIDFMCRPEIAKLNCEEIRYSSPNTGAIELMGDAYISNTTMNPSEETVASCEYFKDIQDVITTYNTLWSQIKNAK
jgi:spermidine/putrescine transport system substrate-binding protein